MKTERIGFYDLYILNEGTPDLQRLGLSPQAYDLKCKEAGKNLNAFTVQIKWQGPMPTGADERDADTFRASAEFVEQKEKFPERLLYVLEGDSESFAVLRKMMLERSND